MIRPEHLGEMGGSRGESPFPDCVQGLPAELGYLKWWHSSLARPLTRCAASPGSVHCCDAPGKRSVSEHFGDPAGEIPPFLVKPEYLSGYKLEEPGEFFQAVRRIPGEPVFGMKMEGLVRR